METPFPPPNPDQVLYVVGDIHGRSDLLQRLLQVIAEDQGGDPATIVFVGDLIDRGDESAAVLTQIRALTDAGPTHVCLMGNHEKMLLDFLDRPEERGSRWLRNGGLQTLASFGIGGLTETADQARILDASYALRNAMPDGLEDWLRSLPLKMQSGNVAVVHAAADPDLPMSEQPDRTLLWGNAAFNRKQRSDGLWVAHGHVVVDEASKMNGRISVDTGAYFSGRLTAAKIAPGGDVVFLST